jgi:hypothetical protein
MVIIKTKSRNRLDFKDDMRVALFNIWSQISRQYCKQNNSKCHIETCLNYKKVIIYFNNLIMY